MFNLLKRNFQNPITFKTNIRMASNTDKSASMLSGHAQYTKGYVEETVGNVTGSEAWQKSGQQDAKAGIDEMRVRLIVIEC
jgi:uncharacterized protein YjbJ (UPF0337 family)